MKYNDHDADDVNSVMRDAGSARMAGLISPKQHAKLKAKAAGGFPKRPGKSGVHATGFPPGADDRRDSGNELQPPAKAKGGAGARPRPPGAPTDAGGKGPSRVATPARAAGGAGMRPKMDSGVGPGSTVSGPLAGSSGTSRGNVVGGVDTDFDHDQDNEGTGTQRANTRTGGAYSKLSAPGGDKTAAYRNPRGSSLNVGKQRPRGSDRVDTVAPPLGPSWGR